MEDVARALATVKPEPFRTGGAETGPSGCAARPRTTALVALAATCGCFAVPSGELPPWKFVQPNVLGLQHDIWCGGGAFEGVRPAAGVSVRTSLLVPGACAMLYGQYYLLEKVDRIYDPGRPPPAMGWFVGPGIVLPPLVAAGLEFSSGAAEDEAPRSEGPRSLAPPFLWQLSPNLWAGPEASLEYSSHDVDGGDRLGALRWLVGMRLQTVKGERRWEAYGVCGLMVAEMFFEARDDSVALGPYAGVGVSMLMAERGRTCYVLYVECTGGLLWDEGGRPGSCVAIGMGIELRR